MNHGHARARRVEEAAHIGEENEEIGVDERGHHRRELIVVPELDLFDGDRVVLVQDGNGAGVQEGREGRACVVGPHAIGEIGVRQEDLRHGDPARRKSFLVRAHEHGLPGGSGSLKARHLLGASAVPEPLRPQRDGAARDEDDRAALLVAPRRAPKRGGDRRRRRRRAFATRS